MITNTSELPTNCESFKSKSLSNVSFTDNDIGKIIKGLDPNKAHGHDMIGIRIWKNCGDSIYKLLRTCLDQGTFLLGWKKASVVSIHKKKDKLSIKK